MNGIVKVHHVTHGSPEWKELRALGTWNASEAPIIMGDHPKVSRDEHMHAAVTMTPKEFDDYTLNVVFEEGHETEERARKILSERIHDELYRVTVTNQCEDYVLLSSLDGATMELTISMEHKQWSMALVAYLEENGEPPPFIYWQLEHQLATVPEMEKVLFVISDGTAENMVVYEYRRVPGRWERLLAGWRQWREDKKNYIPKLKVAKLVGIRPSELPVPVLEVEGQLTTKDNLKEFDTKFREMLATFNAELKTDQDFAQAAADVKYMEDLRKRLEQSKKLALGKAVSLDEAFRLIDDLDELARVTAKNLEEQIKVRKNNVKKEIADEASARIVEAVRAGQDEFLPQGVAFSRIYTGKFDPYEHMKNLKSFDSMRNKVNSAAVKILLDISELKDKVRAALKHIKDNNGGYDFLFRDLNELVVLEPNILAMMCKQRIQEHTDKLKETETARVNAHRQVLIRLEAALDSDAEQSIELLRLARRHVETTDVSKLEEFATEGATKKQKAIDHLNALIAKVEAAEAAEEQRLATEKQAEVDRQLEANRQTEELSRAAVLKAQEDDSPPLDVQVEDFTESPNLVIDVGTVGDDDDALPITHDLEDFSDGASDGGAHAGVPPFIPTARGEHYYPGRTTYSPAPAPVADDRPTNDKIIGHLMSYYAEDRATIVLWLQDLVRTL